MKKTVHLLLAPLILIGLLWLPFGFHMGGMIEEWGLLRVYVKNGPLFFAGADSPLALHQLRPFMTSLWAIAYSIDPNSWWFWHVELMLSLLLKGAAMAWVGFYLTQSRRWSVIAGMLLIVWPADTLQIAFRALNVGFSEGLSILSASFLIAAYNTNQKYLQAILATLAGLSLISGAWMYELTLMITPLPIFLMLARNGIAHTLTHIKSKLIVTSLWLSSITVSLCYILQVLLTAKETYQKENLGDFHQIFFTVKQHILELFTTGFLRSLIGGWLDAAHLVFYDLNTYSYFISVTIIIGLIIWKSGKTDNDYKSPIKRAVLIRTLVTGLIFIALAYAPLLAIPSHLAISQRTFMFTAPGSVIVFLALLIWLSARSKILALTTAIILITLGFVQQLYQFDSYEQIYDQQRKILKAIIEQVPTIPTGYTLILLDESQRVNHTWMQKLTLKDSLTYLYNKQITAVEICLMPSGTWQITNGLASTGTCHETANAWVFKPIVDRSGTLNTPPPADTIVKKSNVIIATIYKDGSIQLTLPVKQHRTALQTASTITGKRYVNMLSEKKWPLDFHLFRSTELPNSYQWDFGHLWSLEQPIQGSGWQEANWTYTPFHQTATTWINQPSASLLFNLSPLNETYQLTIHAVQFANPTNHPLKIKINGAYISGQWTSSNNFAAFIPLNVLVKGINTLELESPINKSSFYGLSLQIDQIILKPTKSI